MTKQEPLRESHLRSLVKGLSWRFVATSTTMVIAFFITGQMDLAIKIGGIEVVAKILIYYGHERLWQMVPRGTVRKLIGK